MARYKPAKDLWEARRRLKDGRRLSFYGKTEAEAEDKAIATIGYPAHDRVIGSVYFIQCGESGPIKIGTAFDVASRLVDLQGGCPFPLRVLFTMPGSQRTEIALHRRFRHLRQSGEWFSPPDDVLHFIQSVEQFTIPMADI